MKVSTTKLNSYWQDWLDRQDEESCENLLKSYQYLVKYHVGRIAISIPNNISQDELFSFGMSGLYDALMKFEPERDLQFDTYASFRVRGAIIDGLRKEDWLSRSLREKIKKIEATTEHLQQKLLRKITSKDLAKELDMTETEIESIVAEGYFANLLSIEEIENEKKMDEKYTATSIMESMVNTPEDSLMKSELKVLLTERIKALNEKEQLVLSLFYYEELTLTEIGEVMNLTTSRISQIHSKALFKLKELLRHDF